MGLMALCAALWSIGGLFIKLISWDPMLIAGLRSIIAAVATGIYIKLIHQKLEFNKWSLLSGLAVGSVCGMFVFANKLTTAANAIVLQYSSPVWILLICIKRSTAGTSSSLWRRWPVFRCSSWIS